MILPLLLTLAACGKKNDEASAAPVAQPINTLPYYPTYPGQPVPNDTWTNIQGGWSYYYANYQFWDSTTGCTTELRRASGNDPQYVRSQICSFLHNEWMNHSCAQSKRMALSLSLCGY
jgi:hypothetical protein